MRRSGGICAGARTRRVFSGGNVGADAVSEEGFDCDYPGAGREATGAPDRSAAWTGWGDGDDQLAAARGDCGNDGGPGVRKRPQCGAGDVYGRDGTVSGDALPAGVCDGGAGAGD